MKLKILFLTTPQMTQRYAHLGEDQMRAAVEKIDTQLKDLLYNSISAKAALEKNSTVLAHSAFCRN